MQLSQYPGLGQGSSHQHAFQTQPQNVPFAVRSSKQDTLSGQQGKQPARIGKPGQKPVSTTQQPVNVNPANTQVRGGTSSMPPGHQRQWKLFDSETLKNHRSKRADWEQRLHNADNPQDRQRLIDEGRDYSSHLKTRIAQSHVNSRNTGGQTAYYQHKISSLQAERDQWKAALHPHRQPHHSRGLSQDQSPFGLYRERPSAAQTQRLKSTIQASIQHSRDAQAQGNREGWTPERTRALEDAQRRVRELADIKYSRKPNSSFFCQATTVKPLQRAAREQERLAAGVQSELQQDLHPTDRLLREQELNQRLRMQETYVQRGRTAAGERSPSRSPASSELAAVSARTPSYRSGESEYEQLPPQQQPPLRIQEPAQQKRPHEEELDEGFGEPQAAPGHHLGTSSSLPSHFEQGRRQPRFFRGYREEQRARQAQLEQQRLRDDPREWWQIEESLERGLYDLPSPRSPR